MKYSKLFGKTVKETPHDEQALNAQLLIRAGFVDKLMAGVYTFLPLGLKVFKKIENIIREEMELVGGQEILMPVLHPKVNWETTGRWEIYDTLFRFASFYSKIDYALGPTHEEVVSPLAKKFVFSYKDLPFAVFQIQDKFRDEKRAKSGLLRGREFFMKDLYSFHADEKDLDGYYEKVKEVYARIFEKAGIGDKTYLTYASGGTFSKYSHEFQTVSESGEDTIYICDKCKIAVNKEIIEEQSTCPNCGNKDLKEEKAIEVGNIFKLMTKYSKPFNLTYKDKDGLDKDVVMGCYGIGLARLIGTIVEAHHDEKGIIWPEKVAPFEAYLIHLGGVMASAKLQPATPEVSNSSKIKSFAEEVYGKLQEAGVEVLYDDREDVSAGAKFADADLIGIPIRLVISERTQDKIEWKERSKKETELLTVEEVLDRLEKTS